jgi:maleylacetate reductase
VLDFTYTGHPSQIVFGFGATDGDRFARHIEPLSAQRIMVVATEGRAALVQQMVAEVNGVVAGRFTGVVRHVPVERARAGIDAARDYRADALLCVGGGSATGTAKAIALELGLPIIAVPTTYAGSEVTPVWGLTEGGRKLTGIDARVLPRLVIYDPALTLALPVSLSVVSGLNALAHCVEALWSPGRNPITSLLAQEGMRNLAIGLPALMDAPADVEARSLTLYGAWLAGTAFAGAGSDLHHKICHALGGAFDLPHAELHAVVLPYATALAAPREDEADHLIAAALGAPNLLAADAVYALGRRLNAPRSLAEIGLMQSDLDAAAAVLSSALSALPRPVSRAEIEQLLEGAFAGEAPKATRHSTQ